MELIVDVHEPERLVNKAQKHFDSVKVKPLPVGDFVCLENGVCIERKDIVDFAGSVQSGRLFRQAQNMVDNFENCFVIISGGFEKIYWNGKVHFTQNMFMAAQASLSTGHRTEGVKIPCHHVQNDAEFIRLVKFLVNKSNGASKDFADINRIMPCSEDVVISQIACIPRIGPKKAEALVKTFNLEKITDLSEYTEEEIASSVKGIGKRQARVIKEYI